MTASMAMMAAKSGMGAALAMNDAFRQQAAAALQSGALQIQMDEIQARTKMQIQNIYKTSEKVQSAQTAAFVAGGVEISGSALSVISDTINDAAQAAYIRQRESDYDTMSIGMEKYAQDQAASNETMLLKVGAGLIGAGAEYAGAVKDHNKVNGGINRSSGGYGLGDTYAQQDAFGGTTGYSKAYMEM